jgi:hypothetical protein
MKQLVKSFAFSELSSFEMRPSDKLKIIMQTYAISKCGKFLVKKFHNKFNGEITYQYAHVDDCNQMKFNPKNEWLPKIIDTWISCKVS